MPRDDEAPPNANLVANWLLSTPSPRAYARVSTLRPSGSAAGPTPEDRRIPTQHIISGVRPASSTTDPGTSQATTLVNSSPTIDSDLDDEPQPASASEHDVHEYLQHWPGHGQVSALRHLAGDDQSQYPLATTVSISTNDAIARVTGNSRRELRQSRERNGEPPVEPAVAGPSNVAREPGPRGVRRVREESAEPADAPPAQRARYNLRPRGPAGGRGL